MLGPAAPDPLGATFPRRHILSTLEVYLDEPLSEVEARFLDVRELLPFPDPASRDFWQHWNRSDLSDLPLPVITVVVERL